MPTVDVVVPDIGTEEEVDVIEVLVKAGDFVNVEDALISVESDKATMDVPATQAGTVLAIKVSAGDRIREGAIILTLDAQDDSATQKAPAATSPDTADAVDTPKAPAPAAAAETSTETQSAPGAAQESVTIVVPDVGTDDAVDVIEILVSAGSQVAVDDPLITLESDKASMDVPATLAGTIATVHVSVGDKVSAGDSIVTLTASVSTSVGTSADTSLSSPTAAPMQSNETSGSLAASNEPALAAPGNHARTTPASASKRSEMPPPPPIQSEGYEKRDPATIPHASPSLRRFARELGADLTQITGTGRKQRILREDIQQWVKAQLTGGAATAPRHATGGSAIPPIPAVDFSKFGEIENVPLSRIKRISGPFLQRSWLNVPHVTHHDEADVTEMEEFRQSLKAEAKERGVRVTPIVFAMRALVAALRKYPQFNASLAPDGEHLILKKYFHIGIAVDTPGGLVVPVVRDVDRKGLYELAAELGDISERARDGKLKSSELQGGCMSISSLGGIGGTAFTPIVNAPEVAILGLARSKMTPVWDGSEFKPRLMQPLDLSYDHRAVDGAEAARFTVYLRDLLGDIRRLVL